MHRAVRVARTLAFLSSAVSCGGARGPDAPAGSDAASAAADAASHETLASDGASTIEAGDAASDASGETHLDPPSCQDAEDQTTCAAGNVCQVDRTNGNLRCDPPDAGMAAACGRISCGWLCACSDPVLSICTCYGGGGPLLPPELPVPPDAARSNV